MKRKWFAAALTVTALIFSSLPASATVLWHSSFEAENGAAVTDGQAISLTANYIDTGVVGGTRGTAFKVGPTAPIDTYVSSLIPTATDPLGVSGHFAISTASDNDWYIDTKVPSNTSGGTEVTMEGFFNLQENVTAAGHRRMVGQKRSTGIDQGRAVATIEYDAMHGAVLGATYTSGSTSFTLSGTTTIDQNAWHHFALVVDFDDVTSKYAIRGYLDGAQEFDTGYAITTLSVGTGFYSIGGLSATTGQAFMGQLDEIRISTGALPPDQFLIPEPATLACLAAGFLLLRRSRRGR
jgi:hypothetical protein